MYNHIKDYDIPRPKDGYRLINNKTRALEDESVIAYCTSSTHPGFLTRQMISQHNCFYKNCPYLLKLPEKEFWQNNQSLFKKQLQNGAIEASRNQKELSKRKKKKAADIAYIQDELCSKLRPFVEKWAKSNFGEDRFLLVDIRPFDGSAKNFRIFYVSNNPGYDAPSFARLCQILRKEFKVGAYLTHIKDLDGHYVTIEEYRARKKNR